MMVPNWEPIVVTNVGIQFARLEDRVFLIEFLILISDLFSVDLRIDFNVIKKRIDARIGNNIKP